jgi:5-methylcytosine-specific restriction endonuclease McrA
MQTRTPFYRCAKQQLDGIVFKVDDDEKISHTVTEYYDGPHATYWIVTPDIFSIMPPSAEMKKLAAKPDCEVESKIIHVEDVIDQCEWYVANDGDCFPLTNHLSYHDVNSELSAVPDIVIDHAIDKFKALLYDQEISIHQTSGILTQTSRNRVVFKLRELATIYESLVEPAAPSAVPTAEPIVQAPPMRPVPPAVPTVVPAKPSAPAVVPPAHAVQDEAKRPPRAHRPAITDQLREAVWRKRNGKRDVGKCFVCETPLTRAGTECGHIVAFIDGGATSVANMEPICRKCNRGMKDRNLKDYKKALGL